MLEPERIIMHQSVVSTSTTSPLHVADIAHCDFPIEAREIKGYNVLVLPLELQKHFDAGCHAVRIHSTTVARALPAFGGKTVSSHSLLPHQDHFPNDPRRFLSLSKEENGSRGSGTYIVHPDTIRRTTPSLVGYFKQNRELLRGAFSYDKSFQATEADLDICFAKEDGIDEVVQKNVGRDADPETLLFAYSGILTYLIQGEYADQEVRHFLEQNSHSVFIETWESGGVFILDNSRVFHGRIGGNSVPLKRNWLISSIRN